MLKSGHYSRIAKMVVTWLLFVDLSKLQKMLSYLYFADFEHSFILYNILWMNDKTYF